MTQERQGWIEAWGFITKGNLSWIQTLGKPQEYEPRWDPLPILSFTGFSYTSIFLHAGK